MRKFVVALVVSACGPFLFAQTKAGQSAPATTAAPKTGAPSAANEGAKPTDDPVILTVGTTKFTKSQFERLVALAQQPGAPKPQLNADGRRKYAENIAELIVLAQEARKQHIDQEKDVQFQIALRADQFLAYSMFQKITSDVKVDDQARHAYYDEHKGDWESVDAKHILIRFKNSPVPLRTGQVDRTDEEALAKAKDLRAKIVGGQDFAALAKTESDDTGSGANGGELGEFTRGKMVPQFEEAAFAAKVGEVTEPIKTQFGYHIILVSKHETKKYEDVSSEIDQKLKPEMAQKAIDQLKGQVPVTFDPDYFGR